jgi:dihydropteroate synthase
VILRLRDRTLELSEPLLMGIVNATPHSFSDRQGRKTLSELVRRGVEQVGLEERSRRETA